MADRFHVPPPDRRKRWADYDADELQAILVADAGAAHATDLPWFVGAVQRIALLRRITLEQAMLGVVEEVRSTHGRELPMHSGVIL